MAAFRVMKYAVLFLFFALTPAILAQSPKPKPASVKKPAAAKPKVDPTPTPVPLSEKEQFDKASAHELAADRVAALDKFVADFPQSENIPAAAELLASSRILIAEEKLLSGDGGEAVAIYKKVVTEYPLPFPNELYTDSISKIPQTLYFRGQRPAAVELANLIESKVESDAAKLLEVAGFYLRIENGAEAMRIAAKAAAKDPSSGAVYRTIALAHRINFDLELSADAYAKSLELDPESIVAKRGLAEMKRALGKSDEAVTLYRDLLSKNEGDLQSRNGLILALFESNKRTEAETELAKSIEKTPNNFALLAGAAYWYASHGAGDKAVELAEKALAVEPRYIWSHIALARGLARQGKPVAAEQVLVRARSIASFPTLEYELASVRMAAGFFRDAADDLAKHFTVTGDGVNTRLGGRILRTEKSLADLAAAERRASIFAHDGADTADEAERLRGLLLLNEELRENEPAEEALVAAADVFTGGTDKMRFHRQVFAALEILKKRVALPKVLELTKAVAGTADSALEVADPGAAIMATELYDARQAAFRKNDFLLVPDVPRATLSAIFRERIEEIAGWALYQQGNYADATIRLKRAANVAPAKSAWARSSMWRLGASLAAEGKDAEALNAYIESYKDDKPDYAKFVIVETLYRKVNGTVEGLEEKIGRDRVVASSVSEPQPAATPAVTIETPLTAPAATENSPNSSTAPPLTPSKLTIDRSNDLFKAIPKGVPVETKTDTDSGVSKTVETAPATKSEAIPEATPVVKKEEPARAEAGKQEPVVEEKKVDTHPADIKKDDALLTGNKDEPTATEAKKSDPTLDEKKADPMVTEVKKAEPTAPEVKRDDPPPGEIEKEESRTELRKEEPPPVEVKRGEPAAVEIKRDEPTVPEPKRDEPPVTPPTETRTEKPIHEIKTVSRTEVIKSEPSQNSSAKPVDDAKASARKPLFEPVIITVPDSRRQKAIASETKTRSDEKAVHDDKAKSDDSGDAAVGNARPRIIDGQEVKVDAVTPCTVNVSQERISLLSDGGMVGILVDVQGPGDIKSLTATSSSSKDVEVTLQPEISGLPDRRFFVIKSLTSAAGAYQVTFAMPCGSKDVLVTVR